MYLVKKKIEPFSMLKTIFSACGTRVHNNTLMVLSIQPFSRTPAPSFRGLYRPPLSGYKNRTSPEVLSKMRGAFVWHLLHNVACSCPQPHTIGLSVKDGVLWVTVESHYTAQIAVHCEGSIPLTTPAPWRQGWGGGG